MVAPTRSVMSKPDEGVDPILASRPTCNPYRHAADELIRRLRWDLRPVAWRSRARLRQSRDRFAGQRCVILCNGPSLLHTDFDLLTRHQVFCFGLNKINLLFETSAFRPNCVVAVNPLVIEQNREFYNTTELPLLLDAVGIPHVRFRRNVAFLHTSMQSKFARDCSISVQQGFTVTYVALQLAYHYGFRRVALVGCDHSFAASGPPNSAVRSEGQDQSHFDPRYFSGGQLWHLPDLAGSEYFYSLAGRTFAAFGGEVVNATAGGKLEIFRRQSLASFLSET
jgi:hypothetical protein